jgi:hypothetical protein
MTHWQYLMLLCAIYGAASLIHRPYLLHTMAIICAITGVIMLALGK